MDIIFSVLTQGLLFFPLVLGIYISYIILQTTDMTIDGSFVLGAGVFARLATNDIHPVISMFVAVLAGVMAGILVSAIQAKNKVNSLIAGILALFILYSFNLVLMGRPNISLLGHATLSWNAIAGIVLVLTILVGLLVVSRFGMVLRAFGENQNLLKKLGKSVELYRFTGLALSNALVALCGALTAQVNGYADIGMGFGVTLTGIGAVVIGRHLVALIPQKHSFSIRHELGGCFLGVSLYFLAINLFLSMGINTLHIKMLLGIILVFLLRSTIRQQITT
jgi:putative tryptophan/tyrosine transport system permease protein